MSKNFQVTINDASKTVYLDDDGNPIPEAVASEPVKTKKGGIANADQT